MQVKPSYDGYTVFMHFLVENVSLTCPNQVPSDVSPPLQVSRDASSWDRDYMTYYLVFLPALLPVNASANYDGLLQRYELGIVKVRPNVLQASLQICQTFADPTVDNFTATFTGFPTVWGKPSNYMGCSSDPIGRPNSPHTLLGGHMCIGGLDPHAMTVNVLKLGNYNASHNLWRYADEF